MRTHVSKEYSSKFKKQEERFQMRSGEDARRIQQLEYLKVTLRAANSRYKTARDRAITDCAKVQADLDSLAADMHDLSQQVGPVAAQAEARHQREEVAQLLGVQRDRMFRELVEHANRVAESLGITSPNVPAGGNHDVATYLAFFNELLQSRRRSLKV